MVITIKNFTELKSDPRIGVISAADFGASKFYSHIDTAFKLIAIWSDEYDGEELNFKIYINLLGTNLLLMHCLKPHLPSLIRDLQCPNLILQILALPISTHLIVSPKKFYAYKMGMLPIKFRNFIR